MSEHTPASPETPADSHEKRDFIRQIVREDLASGKHQAIKTRFPPEPNGYLHIGHAKSICLNFGIAGEFSGVCNLRFDDTNPAKEDPEYVAAIQDDVRWLGFEWNELRHASDYFQAYYLAAEKLIEQGKAYVCDLSAEEVRAYRGTLTEPGRPSPWRDRSVEENLDLFRRMRAGEFPDGARTLRAKIDMASGNINLRDPALYRIKHVEHQNTGNAWPIYPMYDFAHALGDSIEGITHSLCTLEFEDHRPLYDWCVDNVDFAHDDALTQPLVDAGLPREAAKPRQIEFSRLNINYTVMSKRKLMALVTEQLVDGWEDPRMPTLQGLRRRGYTPAAMRLFAERVGISKQNSLIDFSVLEGALREDLDSAAPRRMAVVDPVKLVLTNLPEGHEEQLTFSNHPKDESFGSREVPFAREVWIDREDFAEVPPKGWKRLVPGGEVRLRGAGIIRCDEVIKDADGTITELRGWLDPESRPGMEGANRKVKGTIHWVSAVHGVPAEIRLYDRLFSVPNPDDESEGKTYRDYLNPESRRTVTGYVEPAAASAAPEQSFQFERTGYFVADRRDHTEAKPVFNRSVTLRDTWSA
ncbi:TPA: glutamine--tRNA ligase/YqeY domain fusion protein [Stenotrophomonas maltophilia]|jgi:glutaminyl-tRNA synthetase|uniref:glutamine--tRNA ligase/YqeY domain fusion protein n=1 Tax=Stenotrophomonas maltophilia TaxID=40324 RepID=UPI001462D865|nr:glutamine--tRNA ligase/YqeY domain fusion protein [Stenotrophomonas maltophilia]MBH1382245.1 glutamine--tRNA ligase/YqeY domain fusion protein [Stenotrophomonas maltophilia]MBH1398650.1 glutamine--tRNA ligase/YqeY domain fusion protein [Stenotrophomonas maltophilia]MBH1468829.1 glutamine--tRNA ligase/YqeY domain fusion protein [Stenotrophomonas maltophilia]MBH1474469.1 glutamine--tRNA ligase/YqeY domain fusion protein [Stenotrophomonas maltophilia]QJP18660.1 glutamine--tRNA ligase/YqeY doma